MSIINLGSFLNDVRQVVDTGGKVNREFTRVAGRWEAFASMDTDAVDALAAAVVGNTPVGELPALRAHALADLSGPVSAATITNHVAGSVLAVLRREYAATAVANHATMAAEFNAVAELLTASNALVDLGATAESVMYATDEVRLAWGDVPQHAAHLEALAAAVRTAARLAGFAHAGTPEGQLALVVDPGDVKRRAVWSAWEDSSGRAGRWGHLLSVGVTVTARPLDDVQPYRKPRPMEVRHVRSGIGFGTELVDPEEEDTNAVTLAPGRG